MSENTLADFVRKGIESLSKADPELFGLIEKEYERQTNTLNMVAASSLADPSVLACEGLVLGNITTEGYPGCRFHAGCEFIDVIERLTIERAKTIFGARYANVQPHSGTSANQAVMLGLLKPGDAVLGMKLSSGGHLSHGAMASVSGQYFKSVGYSVDQAGFINYDEVLEVAKKHRPALIICGASAYPRTIDFKRFREIADVVGAYLLADISHIAGLVAVGAHPSPIEHAHFTTTSTYKQLYGPRGGLILMGKDADSHASAGERTLSELIQRAVFPFLQGTPNLGAIAAKARALDIASKPSFKLLIERVVEGAKALAESLMQRGFKVVTRGTDNHLVLVDIAANGLTGLIAERALEECGIIVNKNSVPGDQRNAFTTSGVRMGANSLALRGIGAAVIQECASLISKALTSTVALGDHRYLMDEAIKQEVRSEVKQLCSRFPIPHYPILSEGLIDTPAIAVDTLSPSLTPLI